MYRRSERKEKEKLKKNAFVRAMKGEIDHITSKVETLEMNQETAHTVSKWTKDSVNLPVLRNVTLSSICFSYYSKSILLRAR